MKALVKSYGDVVGNAMDLVELKIELKGRKKCSIRFQGYLHRQPSCELHNPYKYFETSPSTHLIEFAFESVVVEIIGDVLQLAMLVEIDSGVVRGSIVDLAVV
jgi:hypothetical protein